MRTGYTDQNTMKFDEIHEWQQFVFTNRSTTTYSNSSTSYTSTTTTVNLTCSTHNCSMYSLIMWIVSFLYFILLANRRLVILLKAKITN